MRLRDRVNLPSFRVLVTKKKRKKDHSSTTRKGTWSGYGLVCGKWIPLKERNG